MSITRSQTAQGLESIEISSPIIPCNELSIALSNYNLFAETKTIVKQSLCPVRYSHLYEDRQSLKNTSKSLFDFFWCPECHKMLNRSPVHLVREIISYYCPCSLENLPTTEAMSYFNRSPRVFQCPICTNVLSTMASTAKTLQSYLNKSPSTTTTNEGSGDNGVEVSNNENQPKYYLSCNYCHWDSLEIGMINDSPEDIVAVAVQLEKDNKISVLTREMATEITNSSTIQASSKLKFNSQLVNPRHAASANQDDMPHLTQFPWRWADIDALVTKKSTRPSAKLDASGTGDKASALFNFVTDEPNLMEISTAMNFTIAHQVTSNENDVCAGTEKGTDITIEYLPFAISDISQKLQNLGTLPNLTCNLLPQRPMLRTKQVLRCRSCVEENRPNIIVQPQINPLKGDSSKRANVGRWFNKDSHAYHFVPRIKLQCISIIGNPILNQETGGSPQRSEIACCILFTNPTESLMRIRVEEVPNSEPEGEREECNHIENLSTTSNWMTIDPLDDLELLDHKLNRKKNQQSNEIPSKFYSTDDRNYIVGRAHNQLLVEFKGTLVHNILSSGTQSNKNCEMYLRLSFYTSEEEDINGDGTPEAEGWRQQMDTEMESSEKLSSFGAVIDLSEVLDSAFASL